jgi:hypothetical protein
MEPVENLIHLIRGQRIILDADLARVYGVPTKRLNEAVKRTLERFPSDFAFLLKPQEVASLRSQIATSKGRGGHRDTIRSIINAKAQRRKDARDGKAVARADHTHKTVNGGRVNKRLVFFAPLRLCAFALKPFSNLCELEAGLGSQTSLKQKKVRASSRRLLH